MSIFCQILLDSYFKWLPVTVCQTDTTCNTNNLYKILQISIPYIPISVKEPVFINTWT